MKAQFISSLLLLSAFTAGAVTVALPPRIVSIQLDGSNVVVTADVPAGVERVVLESCRRNDLHGWIPRASERVSGAGRITFTVGAPADAEQEMFRVRSDEQIPLPASFYSGKTDFAGEWFSPSGGPAASGFLTTTLSVNNFALVEPQYIYSSPTLLLMPQDNRRVIPIGDWVVTLSGTEVRVSAAEQPDITVSEYTLDDLPILGAASDGTKIHVLQGRAAPFSGGIHWIGFDGATGETNRDVLQHVVLDAAHLPDLAVTGTSSIETMRKGNPGEAEALWPQPGLLVWSVAQRQQSWRWSPIEMYTVESSRLQLLGSPLSAEVSVDLQYQPISIAPAIFRPVKLVSLYEQSPALVAVDVSAPDAPHMFPESFLPQSPSISSELFAADGLVFYSHTTPVSEIVSTNVTVQTNQIWVTVTNLVWQTNWVRTPRIIAETNFPAPASMDAVKLDWPGPVTGSKLKGGFRHSLWLLGLNGGGDIVTWGDNSTGAVGPGQPATIFTSTHIPSPQAMTDVAATFWQSLAVDGAGTVWHWGGMYGPTPPIPGQPAKDHSVPEPVPLPAPVSAISAGGWHAMALASDGRAWAWGANYHGQLGQGHRDPVTAPQPVPGTFASISCGALHNLALDADGRVFSWGWNQFGQLGRNSPFKGPAQIDSPPDVIFRAIAAGAMHSLALADDGTVWAWGDARFGQIGASTNGSGVGPQPVSGLPAARAIAAGWNHSLVLADDGQVWLLHPDPETASPIVSRVSGLTNVVALGAGSGADYCLALTGDNSLFVWGDLVPFLSMSNATVQLLLESATPVIQTRTNYIMVGTVVQVEQTSQQPQSVMVTNATPVYWNGEKHWLDVVDYNQDAASPAFREPASLPGQLQGISHGGALLYALTMASTTPGHELQEIRLSGLAYDGIAAHLVNAVTLSTNSAANTAHVGVHPDGVVVVSLGSRTSTSPGQLECWHLGMHGQFELLGSLDRTTSSDALRLLDDLAVLRTGAGFEIVDFVEPASPVALPINESSILISTEINRVSGSRSKGVWLPAREQGAIPLWRP